MSTIRRTDWFDSDEGRCHVGVDLADQRNENIDHGTARAIAAMWDGPGVAHTFVTRGAIPDGDVRAVLSGLFDGVDMSERGDRLRHALTSYLHERAGNRDTGPVPMWASLWAPYATGGTSDDAIHTDLSERDYR